MVFVFSCRKYHLISALLAFMVLIQTGGPSQAATTDHPNGSAHMQTPAASGVVVVKMAPGAEDRINHLIQSVKHLLPQATATARFPGLKSNLKDTVLRQYFQLDAQGLDRSRLLKLVAVLNADPSVEVAFLEPVAVPAALGFDAFTGAVPEPAPSESDHQDPVPSLNTPDFEPDQGYLQDAPLGVGALTMRNTNGALGAGITVIDVEGAWLWTHEDLPAPAYELGVQFDSQSWRDHGTAVLSEIRGQDNGLGVSGIAPQCSVGCSSIGGINTATALAAAVDVLQRGDIILIELHAPGPNATGVAQVGYVPMEYWPDNFDIIRLATAKGIIVCEAAGNGYQNLDWPEYEGLFDRTIRDSGAIMCGATSGSELYSADFSNNGSRVDLNGWGWNVTAAGYGNLQGGEETEWYTWSFNGTSSASPIVTGAVASLQGMVLADWGVPLDARLARNILLETGTVMESGHEIGTRPNLVEAFAHADTIIGAVRGIVTDDISGEPLAGVLVQVSGYGSFTMTDAAGWWQLPLVEGPVNLEFSSYDYHTKLTTTAIVASAITDLDETLTPLDRINITGQVFGPDGPISGVMITPTNQPVSGDMSGINGAFSINVPALYEFNLLFDGASGFGARMVTVFTAGYTEDVVINPLLPLTSENFDPDGGGFTDETGLWTHGAPPAEVTGGAFDSWACWGVGMDGDYGHNETAALLSPTYNLSGVTGNYFLSFHYFSATETSFDGVNLEVLAGEEFVLLAPVGGYTDPGLGGLGGEAGWSGNSGRWQGTVFDIADFAGADFQFRLKFGSDTNLSENGFYFDAVSFDSGQFALVAGVEKSPAPLQANLKSWPNPFNPQVNLEYSITRPGHLQVEVFDVRGNRVRTLLSAPVSETRGTLSWDGKQDDGRPASSGVYLVRLVGPDNQITSDRVVLAK